MSRKIAATRSIGLSGYLLVIPDRANTDLSKKTDNCAKAVCSHGKRDVSPKTGALRTGRAEQPLKTS